MKSNRDFIEQSFFKEQQSEELARQNFQRIDQIMRMYGPLDTWIHDTIMDLKVLRMKKVMLKHGRIILTEQQAAEIWGGRA